VPTFVGLAAKAFAPGKLLSEELARVLDSPETSSNLARPEAFTNISFIYDLLIVKQSFWYKLTVYRAECFPGFCPLSLGYLESESLDPGYRVSELCSFYWCEINRLKE
jgi:hypothetical protein